MEESKNRSPKIEQALKLIEKAFLIKSIADTENNDFFEDAEKALNLLSEGINEQVMPFSKASAPFLLYVFECFANSLKENVAKDVFGSVVYATLKTTMETETVEYDLNEIRKQYKNG